MSEIECIYCGKSSKTSICYKCLSERDINRLKNEILFRVEGRVSLNEFRKFILTSIARHNLSLIEQYFNQKNLFPEISGRIWLNANRKEVIGSFEIYSGETVDIVRAYEVYQITYKSKSKHTILKWKAIWKTEGTMSGIATVHSLRNLHEAGVGIDKIKIESIKLNL
ncbi:MAG: hypothetical protein N3E39_01255 [Candidatus Methanomethylicia archaeon]|nr:hypothetical protein [Candidatus Methanomethylicia archaeon]